jgi:hypothetical protein
MVTYLSDHSMVTDLSDILPDHVFESLTVISLYVLH